MHCLVEAQSRDDPAIIFRCLQYLYRCLEDLALHKRLSLAEVADIRWKVYVVYPAVGRHRPSGEVLRLVHIPDRLLDETAFERVDLPSGSLVQDYLDFCAVVNAKISNGCRGTSVFSEIFDECISK